MKNPLYPTTIINYENIRNYNNCIVITLAKTSVSSIFDKEIDENFYNNVKENYTVKSIPMWMIKLIPEYKSKFIIFDISEDDILKFNFSGVTLNDEPISYNLSNACMLIPNHDWFWFSQYIELYIKDGIKNTHTYLMNDNLAMLDIPFLNLINEIKNSYDVLYWKDLYKCRINITDAWLQRDINFSDAKEMNVTVRNQMATKCNNYLQDIINKNRYVDASSGIKTHKHNLYYMNEYSSLPINLMINKLILSSECSNEHKNKIINYCLISKKYCHLLLKDSTINSYINDNFNTFSKSFSYAWLMMYLEEGILKSHVKEADRCVFTLSIANSLPCDTSNKNVYIPLMVEKTYLNMFGGYQSNNNVNKIELSDMTTFKNRFMLFINNNNIDVFKNMDWKNIGISGSIIAAACRKIDPLEKDGGYTTEEFFNTYYKDSDVDVMCDLQEYTEYFDKIYYMISVMKENILEVFPSSENPIQVEIIKNAALQLNIKYIIDNYSGKLSDQDAYNIYLDLKKKEVIHDDVKYAKINEVVDISNFKYYVYDNNESKEPTYGENIKFNISSPYLTRKFEVFRIKYNFLATVSRFHLPCVRGYYDGSEVYLIPSAVSALITNKCIDYKYFAGIRSPFEIILKYIFRGYSIFLNKREMIKIVEYIKNSDKWKNLFKFNEHFRVNTFQSYYSNPYVLLNKTNINYFDYRKYYEQNIISPIISLFGYVLPINL